MGRQNGFRVPDANSCRRFIECRNQKGIVMECEVGNSFETSLRMCLSSKAVNCDGRSSTNIWNSSDRSGGISSNVGSLIVIYYNLTLKKNQQLCSRMPSGSRIQNIQNQCSYFECKNSQTVEVQCPQNQEYDPTTSQCRPDSIGMCRAQNRPSPNLQSNVRKIQRTSS
jgi:hypothetical protein